MLTKLSKLSSDIPVLIAGPTASGKSEIAFELAARDGGVIINADALQVYANWQVLTARPSDTEMAQVDHRLYGHISADTTYSVGNWLRDIEPILSAGERPIIVGGTGLNFTALTEGLADIPPTPPEIRACAIAKLADAGLAAMIAELDAETLTRIDQQNPMRVQRAWEVLQTTGQGLAALQDETPAPVLPLARAQTVLLSVGKDWLNQRIARRFDQMLKHGALDEARENLPTWSPSLPSSKAIGAAELISHLKGEKTIQQVRDSVTIATRQYAKRQRSWFRARMSQWDSFERP